MKKGMDYFLDEMNTWVSHGIFFIALGFMLHDSLYFEIDRRMLMLIIICQWSLMSLLFSYCITYKKVRLTLFVTTLFALVVTGVLVGVRTYLPMILKAELNLYLETAKVFFKWSYAYLLGLTSKTNLVDDMILIVVLYWFMCGALFILSKKNIKTPYYLLGILYFIIQWNQFVESASSLMSLYLVGVLIYHLVQVHERRMKKRPQFKSQKRSMLIYSVLVSICLMGLTHIVVGITPIDRINNALSDNIPDFVYLRDNYKNRLEDRVFDFGTTLYSPLENRLGGTINLKKDLVFKVSSSFPGVKLRGNIKTYYTGDRWIGNNGAKVKFESVGSVDGLERLRIVPMDFKSSTLMTPLNTQKVELQKGKVMVDDQGVLFYKEGFFKSELNDYSVYYDPNNIEPLDLTRRQDYLQLPEEYSKEVKNLTYVIIESLETEEEKALAIEDYLRSHYEYSLKVDDYGERDFVEAFLFEGKRGYCTYFASSMVVMARLSGIPARYVEGYYLPTEKEELDLYRVTADRAHAWPELYIKDKGWVAFEPTPAYEPSQQEITQKTKPVQLDNETIEREHEDIKEDFIGRHDEEKGSNGWLLIILLLLVLVFYIAHLRKQNRIIGTSAQEIDSQRIYRIFRLVEKVDQHCITLKRPDEKMTYLLSKIVSKDCNENDIIDAVNQTLFSPWGMKEVHIKSLLYFEKAVHTYVKKQMRGIVYVYYKISGFIH